MRLIFLSLIFFSALCGPPASAAPLNSVVRITRQSAAGTTIGSGSVIDDSGPQIKILTNAHVAGSQRGGTVEVEFFLCGYASSKLRGVVDWATYSGGTPPAHAPRDAAVVLVDRAALGVGQPDLSRMRDGQSPRWLVSAGCPRGDWPNQFQGHVLRRTPDGLIEFTPEAVPGRSGSPLYAPDGQTLIGLITWADPQRKIGIAQSIDNILAFMAGRKPQAWDRTAAASFKGRDVLLDFYATWCGPCRQMAPLVARLETAGYPVRRIEFDLNRRLAREYDVLYLPTFLMLVNGRVADRQVGVTSYERLEAMCRLANATAAAPTREPCYREIAIQTLPVQIPPAQTIAADGRPIPPPEDRQPATGYVPWSGLHAIAQQTAPIDPGADEAQCGPDGRCGPDGQCPPGGGQNPQPRPDAPDGGGPTPYDGGGWGGSPYSPAGSPMAWLDWAWKLAVIGAVAWLAIDRWRKSRAAATPPNFPYQ